MEENSKPVVLVPVRQLVDFVLRTGDLGGDREFVGRDRALAGTRGHQKIQKSRPAGYQKEVRIAHDLDAGEFILRIQGRIDGLIQTAHGVVLEEIKTVQGRWDRQAEPLHWAQAKIYGYLHARQKSLSDIRVRLVYLNLDTGELTEFEELFSFAELSDFFESTTAIYVRWMREQHLWRIERDASIRQLPFPFATYRPGQEELSAAVTRAIQGGERLFLEAPTGIGKTISVLFPAVNALADDHLERIFYLTARTTGRAVAEKAVTDLRGAKLRLRTLTLTAREKLCVRNGQACDIATCPLAKGYYDRHKAAMREALARETINRLLLEETACGHQVCPFELSMDLSSWVDVIIADYNHVFDPAAYLRRQFTDDPGRYLFLVDEAHNLVDRARAMYSSELSGRELRQMRKEAGKAVPRLSKAIGKLIASLKALTPSPGKEAPEPVEERSREPELALFSSGEPAMPPSPAGRVSTDFRVFPGTEGTARWIKDCPRELAIPVEEVLAEAEAWLARNEPAEFRERLLDFYFQLLSFARALEWYDERFRTILEPELGDRLRLFCLDPSNLLQLALARGIAAVFFSATLTPLEYYRNLLGGRTKDPLLQLASPFPAGHLAILIQDRIRTSYQARQSTLAEVADAIASLVQGRPGNYLVFFPSYQYLSSVHGLFQQRHPSLEARLQRPRMNDGERDAFVAAFAAENRATLVGFAVMGGIFGEGIDLVGERLIGAIIVGVGLPQLSLERDLIREYFEETRGNGFDYAYAFPGFNRVLQAVGRVIRSERDRGVVLLIDPRFVEPRYRRLYPRNWKPSIVRNPGQLRERVETFWETPVDDNLPSWEETS